MATAVPVKYNPQIVPEYSFTNFALNATVATVSAVAVHFFTSALIVSVAVGGSAFILMATVAVFSHRAHNLEEKLQEAQSQTAVDNHTKQQRIDTAVVRLRQVTDAVNAVFTAVTRNEVGEMTLEQQLGEVERVAGEQKTENGKLRERVRQEMEIKERQEAVHSELVEILGLLQVGISTSAKIERHAENPTVQAWNALVERLSGDDGAQIQADMAALQTYVMSTSAACPEMKTNEGRAILDTLTARADAFIQLADDVTAIKQYMENPAGDLPVAKTDLGGQLLTAANALTSNLDDAQLQVEALQRFKTEILALAASIDGWKFNLDNRDGLTPEAGRVVEYIDMLNGEIARLAADATRLDDDDDDDDDDDAHTAGTRTPSASATAQDDGQTTL